MADRTSSSITVAAPRVVVMGVIADFAAYPDWATGVRSAEIVGSGADGRPVTVRFELDAGLVRDRYVLAYRWDGDAEVRWDLSEAGSMISELSGCYMLADDGGGTKVTYELAVGLRIPMIGMMRRRAEKTIIDTALKGLRSRTEVVLADGVGGQGVAGAPGGVGSGSARGGGND
ncbi:MAG: SRPBCC family protein [Streptosporangiaceae bacterium]